nr:MAG TPA: hypothetical protein [Caudoviricetes sp.]
MLFFFLTKTSIVIVDKGTSPINREKVCYRSCHSLFS